ncbi:MAG TPA: DUF5979 domain-containing protein [Acidimicrobiales bacterium]|nr:DUF5979 domain-containing protein [Acidimicrobiales bacterium]
MSNPRRRLSAIFTLAVLLAGMVAVLLPASPANAAPKKPPVFKGYCEEGDNPYDGSCVLDEPEGQDPETYGSVLYDREFTATSDTLRFTFDLPDGLTLSTAQVCLTLLSDSAVDPYTPTNANTCAGKSEDRALETGDPSNPLVVDVYSFFADHDGYEPGGALWFTVHVTGNGMTLAVTGRSVPPDTPPPTRIVSVTKDVEPDMDGSFAFTLDCAETDLSAANTSADEVTFSGGNATFSLADGGSVIFTGIADGDTCTVVETTSGWITSVSGAMGKQAVLSLAGTNAIAAFVNIPVHDLFVTKDVVSPTRAETFSFVVDCRPYVLTSANSPAPGITYADGVASAVLGDNGRIELTGLPHSTTCTVQETVPTVAGGTWTGSVDGTAGVTKTVTLDADRTVAFTNTLATTAVIPPAVEPTATAPAPGGASVLGVQVEQPLARTGIDNTIAVAAVAMIVLGAGLLIGTRRRPVS